MKFVASYSGGKDGALALYRMIQQGHTPVALITTVNIEQKRSWFHGIQNEMLLAVSQSMDIPLILCESAPDNYTQAFEQGLEKASAMGAEACVFGDIDIAGHREWNEERCANTGLVPILPLWLEDREALVQEMLDSGFKAVIKIVQATLGEEFLGKDLSAPLIEKIKATGADPCGENGEYHTFVHDGPVFKYPILFEAGQFVNFGTHKAIEILLKK